MLTVFSLTPQVFDHRCNTHKIDWATCVRELHRAMFPPTGASAVLVADLAEGRWHSKVESVIQELDLGSDEDKKSKWMVLPLFNSLKDVLVKRPACHTPGDGEEDWINESIASATRHGRIARIIATSEGASRINNPGPELCPLRSVQNGKIWDGVRSSGLVPMSRAKQIDLLRPMWMHAKYLALVLPRLVKTEIKFATEVVRARSGVAAMFGSVQVDLHTAYLGGEDENSKLRERLRDELQNPPELARLRLIVWPKDSNILDREILGGYPADRGAAGEMFACRWGGSIGHVAVDESPAADDTKWHVYDRSDLDRRYRRFYDESVYLRKFGSPAIVEVIPDAASARAAAAERT